MTSVALPLFTALLAGFAHALEADHMAAVTAFVSRRPHPLRALGFGIRWGVGHSIAILVAGGALIATGIRMPDTVARALEAGVGLMLVGLGVWVLGGALHRRRYSAAHAAAHSEHRPHSHVRPGGTTWVGVAHGLAGTAALLALVPVTLLSSPWLAGGYLLLFGVGTVAAMALYALVAGVVFHHAADRFPALGGSLRLATGIVSAAIGVVWVWGAMGM